MKNSKEIVSKFRTSIRCGTGAAYILMSKYPEINFLNEIYKASKVNYAYDGQSEGDRSEYLIQFFEKLNPTDKTNLKQKLIKSLKTENDDTWNLKQIFNLLVYFGKKDYEVKNKIYKKFQECPIKDSDWLGEEAIISMDGQKGLLFVVEHYGKQLIQDSENCYNDFLVNNYDEQHPKENIWKVLSKESKSNKYIKAYIQDIKTNRRNWDKKLTQRKEWNLDRVLEHLTNDSKHRPMYFVIEKLSKNELKEIVKLLNEKSSEKTIGKILSLFTIVKYPNNKSKLKEYLKKKYSTSIRDYAYKALGFFRDDELRNKATEKLRTTNNPRKHIELLKSNYKDGDSKLLIQTINRFKNEHKIEEIAVSLCEVCEKNKTKDCKGPLLALYEKMNCAIHRNSILNILFNNGVLPKTVLAEMQYDSDENTRKLHYKIKKKSR